jgi:hypothetical protein
LNNCISYDLVAELEEELRKWMDDNVLEGPNWIEVVDEVSIVYRS